MKTIIVNVKKEKVAEFVKGYANAMHISGLQYAIGEEVYKRDSQSLDKLCSIQVSEKRISYVKLSGMRNGEPFVLFIKETQVLKVLDKLTRLQDEIDYRIAALSVTMRKVRVSADVSKRVQPIVMKSLAYVGIAA